MAPAGEDAHRPGADAPRAVLLHAMQQSCEASGALHICSRPLESRREDRERDRNRDGPGSAPFNLVRSVLPRHCPGSDQDPAP